MNEPVPLLAEGETLRDLAQSLAWAQRLRDEHRDCGRLFVHRAGADDVDGWQPGEINALHCQVHGLFFRPARAGE